MKIIKEIEILLRTNTLKHLFIVFNGSIINGILGAIFYISLARFLGPADFGLFVVVISVLTLIADIADFGTNTGLVKFVSANLNVNKEKALRILKLSLEIKLFIWLSILVVGTFLAPLIANEIFHKMELVTPLRLSMIGVGGALLFSFSTSCLQAFQKFFAWSYINILSNLLRLILIFIILFYQQLNISNAIIIYITLPFLGFFLSSLLLPAQEILKVHGEFHEAKALLNFNRWVALSTIFSAISSRLDIFLNTRLLSVADVGIYGAASQLASIAPQLVGALGIISAPKFASFTSLPQMLVYFKKFQSMVIGLAVLGLLSIPLAFFFIPLLFGQQYIASIGPFIILLLAMLIFLISTPMQISIYYYFDRPDFFAVVSFLNLLIMLIAGFLLIFSFGVIGAAFTVLIGMVFNFIISLIWFLKKLSSKELVKV